MSDTTTLYSSISHFESNNALVASVNAETITSCFFRINCNILIISASSSTNNTLRDFLAVAVERAEDNDKEDDKKYQNMRH